MTLDSAIAFFRQEQADLFRSRVTIKYRSGESFNPTTGAVTPTYVTRATDVPSLIRPRSAADVQAGERAVSAGEHEAKLPVDQEVELDDLVEVTASTHDVGLVGKVFVVKERLHDDWQISRRVILEVYE